MSIIGKFLLLTGFIDFFSDKFNKRMRAASNDENKIFQGIICLFLYEKMKRKELLLIQDSRLSFSRAQVRRYFGVCLLTFCHDLEPKPCDQTFILVAEVHKRQIGKVWNVFGTPGYNFISKGLSPYDPKELYSIQPNQLFDNF